MPVCERNFRSLLINGLNTLDPHRPGANVIAFQLVRATGGPSLSWHARRSRGADPSGAATVIPFRLGPSSDPRPLLLLARKTAITRRQRAAYNE